MSAVSTAPVYSVSWFSRNDFDDFVAAYWEAALWSSTDESGGEPLDKNYDVRSVSDAAMRDGQVDCYQFLNSAEDYLRPAIESGVASFVQAGHDFWLSRNGHGAGFFDGEYAGNADKLQREAKVYGTVDLYVVEGKVCS